MKLEHVGTQTPSHLHEPTRIKMHSQQALVRMAQHVLQDLQAHHLRDCPKITALR